MVWPKEEAIGKGMEGKNRGRRWLDVNPLGTTPLLSLLPTEGHAPPFDDAGKSVGGLLGGRPRLEYEAIVGLAIAHENQAGEGLIISWHNQALAGIFETISDLGGFLAVITLLHHEAIANDGNNFTGLGRFRHRR